MYRKSAKQRNRVDYEQPFVDAGEEAFFPFLLLLFQQIYIPKFFGCECRRLSRYAHNRSSIVVGMGYLWETSVSGTEEDNFLPQEVIT